MPDSVVHFGLLPSFGIKLSMSCAKKGEREYVEEQAHGSADDRGAEAGRNVEDVAGEVACPSTRSTPRK
jgi:hypothetical protein